MTQAATIQVQYVNQPREAHWKSGSIKDSNGQYWNVPKEQLGMFQQGETCEILWEQTGKYPSIVGKGGQLFPKQPTQPQPGSAVPRNVNWPGPQNRPPLTYEKKQDTPEEIFITGVVGRAMGSGSFVIEQIPQLTRMAAYAWKTRHENPEGLSPADSPGHQARTDIDSQYGGDHPEAPPMTDPGDPGWQ